MRKRVMGFLLAVSMFLALTPNTVMAARMEGNSLHIHETAQQTEPAPESEAVPEAAGDTSTMEGIGTATMPYRIQNAGQLCAFADMVNGVNGVPDTSLCAVLMCDIDLSGVCGPETGSWTPIGTSENPYTGTFDGSSFVITGLFCNKSGASYAGLFGRNVGIIKNLGIVGADITAGNYTGGVCGYNNGIITGCYHAASVKGVNYTGGICGYNDGGGTVSVCYNTGTVSGSKYVGGICGYNKNNAADCYNMGPVTGDKTSIGGICGYNKASVSNCFNTGLVVGGGETYIGSICGYNHSKSTFSNCYYLITGEEKGNYGVAMSKEHFASGEVCWLLNGGKSENVIWYQTCGAGFPTFGGKTVYQVQRQKAGGRADEMIVAYTNEKEKKQAANNVSAQENPSNQNSGDHTHEHSYQEPAWEWEEYKAAKAIFICQDCGEKTVLEAAISNRTTAATCAVEGKTVYTASVEKDGKTYQDEKTVKSEKLPHQPLVQILAEAATCVKTGISQNCWTCSACGKYFTDDQGTKEIPKKDVVIPATGHHYVKNGWVWNIDSDPDSNPVKASLNLVCDNPGCGETETKEAQVTSETNATCTSAGETTYTAVVKIDGQQSYTDVRKVSGKPIPHSYGEPQWTWTGYTAATATFTCDNCGTSIPVKADVTETKTPGTDCSKPGKITYTATVNFQGKNYTCPDSPVKEIPEAHALNLVPEVLPKCETNGNEKYWQCSVCHKLFADAAGTNPLAGVPVIPATGHTLEHVRDNIYKCTICGGTYQVTVTSNGTTSITSVEREDVITQDAPTQVDPEEEQEDAVPQSLEEQDGESGAESVKEEPSPQPDAGEKQEEGADQSAGEQVTESNQEKQSEQNEENDQDGQNENLDGIMDTSEHAARYGLIYPEREAGKEEHAIADVREESAVKLRAESKGNAVTRTIQARQQFSLWRSVAALVVLAGAVLILLNKGRRSGNRK